MLKSFHELIDKRLGEEGVEKNKLAHYLQSKGRPKTTAFRIKSVYEKRDVFSKAQLAHIERAFIAKKEGRRYVIPDYSNFSTDAIKDYLLQATVQRIAVRCSFCGNTKQDCKNIYHFTPSNNVQKKPSPFGEIEFTLPSGSRLASIKTCDNCLDSVVEVLAMSYPNIVKFLLEIKYTQFGLALSLKKQQSYISKLKNAEFEAISPFMTQQNADALHRWAIKIKLSGNGLLKTQAPEAHLGNFLNELTAKGFDKTDIHWHKALLSQKRVRRGEHKDKFNSNILIEGSDFRISCYFLLSIRNILPYLAAGIENNTRFVCLIDARGKSWSHLCVDLSFVPFRFCEIPYRSKVNVTNTDKIVSLDWEEFVRKRPINKLEILNSYGDCDAVRAIKSFFRLDFFEQSIMKALRDRHLELSSENKLHKELKSRRSIINQAVKSHRELFE